MGTPLGPRAELVSGKIVPKVMRKIASLPMAGWGSGDRPEFTSGVWESI
jgi:hypothetical protein